MTELISNLLWKTVTSHSGQLLVNLTVLNFIMKVLYTMYTFVIEFYI